MKDKIRPTEILRAFWTVLNINLTKKFVKKFNKSYTVGIGSLEKIYNFLTICTF